MWEWLRSTDARKNSPAAKRREHARLRGRIERLEDRAMLSATMGSMPQVGNGFAPQQFRGLHGGEMSTITSTPYRDSLGSRQLLASQSGSHSIDGGFANHVQGWGGPGYGGPPGGIDLGMSSYSSSAAYSNVLNQYQPAPLVVQPMMIIVVIVPSTARVPTAPATGNSFSDYGNSLPEPANQDKPRSGAPPNGLARVALPAHAPGALPPIDLPKGSTLSSLNSASIASAIGEIPSAAQILSGDINSVALLSNGAVDAAFQSYSPLLLLVTATSASDRALVKSLSDEAPKGDSLGEFIRLADFTIGSDEGVPANPVDRERAAVDEVLSGLQDLDVWPIEPSTLVKGDDDGSAANATELCFAALADAEGGMVMLEANGDANYSDVNLASAADGQSDLLNVRVGVEASVGFYQAFDVATDDMSAANNLSVASPTVEPTHDNRVSTEDGSDPSRKAAAAIGATTLVGAMVWMAQRSRTDDAMDDNAERVKRLRRGNAS